MRKIICVTGAVLALVLSGCGSSETPPEATTPVQSRIEKAAADCFVNKHVADAGKSISFDTKGDEDDDGDPIESVGCVLGDLNTPDYVIEHIDATRALDGSQTDHWKGLEARWAYHPDNGLNITVIDTKMP